MKRGDMVRMDIGKNSFLPLREIKTWETIKGALVNSADVCVVLQVRSAKSIGKSWSEKIIQILTPRGQVGWMTNGLFKIVEENS